MVSIASVIMLKIRYNKSKIFHVTFGILVSVIIYYINHFFNVIIETQMFPIYFQYGASNNFIHDCYDEFNKN